MTITSKILLDWLEQYLDKYEDEDLLFPTYAVMRRITRTYLDSLFKHGHSYSLGGLRAGGATFAYILLQTMWLWFKDEAAGSLKARLNIISKKEQQS